MENLKLKKEIIDMPIEVNHYGWFCDDKDFGNKYKPYRDWIEQKNHVVWEEYYPGMLDNDTSIMQKFCDVNNLSIDCHYDEKSDGIYLIKIKSKNEYKKAINVLLELIERKRDQIFDNKDNDIYKKHLESLRVSVEIIGEDIPYLDPNY